MLKPCAIAYNCEAKTVRVTLLHLVELRQTLLKILAAYINQNGSLGERYRIPRTFEGTHLHLTTTHANSRQFRGTNSLKSHPEGGRYTSSSITVQLAGPLYPMPKPYISAHTIEVVQIQTYNVHKRNGMQSHGCIRRLPQIVSSLGLP